MAYITTYVDIDTYDILSEIETEELVEELRNRDRWKDLVSDGMICDSDNTSCLIDKKSVEKMFEEYSLNGNSSKMTEMLGQFFYNVLGRITT